jgi:hypothetical protein
MDVVNIALENLQYECRSVDGCEANSIDNIHLIVDDEGFSGKGGAMQAEYSLSVTIFTDDDGDNNNNNNIDVGADADADTDADNDTPSEIKQGSPEEGTDQNTVGSPGYRL